MKYRMFSDDALAKFKVFCAAANVPPTFTGAFDEAPIADKTVEDILRRLKGRIDEDLFRRVEGILMGADESDVPSKVAMDYATAFPNAARITGDAAIGERVKADAAFARLPQRARAIVADALSDYNEKSRRSYEQMFPAASKIGHAW
jgi:hypothetical protein